MKDDENAGGEQAGDAAARAAAPTVQLVKGPAEEYLAGVRSALSDLPAPEVAEILDDVRAHLADLTAELGGSTERADLAALTARLGTPAAYAAELRAAAGYPAAPQVRERSGHGSARFALLGLVGSTLLVAFGAVVREPGMVLFGALLTLVALPVLGRDGPRVPTVATLPEVRRIVASRPAEGTAARKVTDFLASLQPAWWLIRAFAASVLVMAPFGGGGIEAVVLLALVAAPLSVWLGRLTRSDRRLIWAVLPLNGLAAALVFTVLAGDVPSALGSPGSVSYAASYQPGLWQDSERQIRDIRPVDAAGNPLTGVYLFDQDGQPIDASGGSECDYAYAPVKGSTVTSTPDPDRPYPRGTRDYDPHAGKCVVTPPGPLVVAVPSASPASPSPTPTAPLSAPAPAPVASPAPAAPPVVPPTG